MEKNFWKKIKKPILALAPMAGITDSAFRQISKKFGADVVCSEMASVNALKYSPKKTLEMLESDKKENPYVIQLFGSDPKNFVAAVKLLTDKKRISEFKLKNFRIPQGIDINFGCPVKKVTKQGAGAVLMDDLKLSREIIKAVIDNVNLPVSIKIRSKVKNTDALKFLENVKDLDIKAVMIHGRTLSQGHSGKVDKKIIKEARNYFNGIILANGGVMNYRDGLDMLKETKSDGLGIARGALGNPWIFSEIKKGTKNNINAEEKFKIAIEHTKLAFKLKGERGILEMRKHLCWYVQNFSGAKKVREKIIKAKTLKDIKDILK